MTNNADRERQTARTIGRVLEQWGLSGRLCSYLCRDLTEAVVLETSEPMPKESPGGGGGE